MMQSNQTPKKSLVRVMPFVQSGVLVLIAVLIGATDGVGWLFWVTCGVFSVLIVMSWCGAQMAQNHPTLARRSLQTTTPPSENAAMSFVGEDPSAEFATMLRVLRTGVITLDHEARIISMNPAAGELLGCAPQEVLGGTCADAGLDEALTSSVDTAIKTGRAAGSELVFSVDGGRRIDLHCEPITNEDGQRSGMLMLLDDLTHVRRLEQMRSDFAANVSHELRTPITSIQGYAELLSMEMKGSDQRGYAEIIERNVRRLSAIIEDLLALSRLEDHDPGQLTDRETFPLADLLREVVRASSEEAEKRNIELELQCATDLHCTGIRRLLEQAIGNLVVNAIRYGPESSTVMLSAVQESEYRIRISVADRGGGIPTEHLDRIFERFYRVDRGRSREVGGTGLGLAIVKHIALVHGGEVEVQSAPETGTVFGMVIPVLT